MSAPSKIIIGEPVSPADEQGRRWHPVTVKREGQEHSARVQFHVVNGQAKWGFGECSDAAFAVINGALIRKGEPAVARMLA